MSNLSRNNWTVNILRHLWKIKGDKIFLLTLQWRYSLNITKMLLCSKVFARSWDYGINVKLWYLREPGSSETDAPMKYSEPVNALGGKHIKKMERKNRAWTGNDALLNWLLISILSTHVQAGEDQLVLGNRQYLGPMVWLDDV